MFGRTHDIDNSFSEETETTTHDVVNLKIDLVNAIEDRNNFERLSLRPLVLKYELELRDLKMKMNLASTVPGEMCKKNVQLWDDEISTLATFITELLEGAHEIL